jgi:hypothetical protein
VVVAKRTASGQHASATASAEAGLHSTFFARVTAAPNQRVAGNWVVGCRVGLNRSHDAGDVTGKTPLTVPIEPVQAESYGMGPNGLGRCTIIALATLARSGRLTVEVLAAK